MWDFRPLADASREKRTLPSLWGMIDAATLRKHLVWMLLIMGRAVPMMDQTESLILCSQIILSASKLSYCSNRGLVEYSLSTSKKLETLV